MTRKAGRPALAAKDRRSVQVGVRLTPAEAAELDARAAALGISRRDMARALVLDGVIPPPPPLDQLDTVCER